MTGDSGAVVPRPGAGRRCVSLQWVIGFDTQLKAYLEMLLEEAREVRRKRRELDHANVAA